METVKLVTVGDVAVGKTSLLITYTSNHFPETAPMVFDNFGCKLTVAGKAIGLGLWDTATRDGYDRLRPLSYPQTDVFLVCFSVVCWCSYENVVTKWLPEIKHHCPQARILLCGLKSDLRAREQVDESESVNVPIEDAQLLARRLGVDYIECSAMLQENVKEVFESAVFLALNGTLKKRKKTGLFSLFGFGRNSLNKS